MSWTDERVALLKQLWGEGKTAAEIAKELGEGVTRNAVIGKAHRLKLSNRVSPIQQNDNVKQEEAPKKPEPVKVKPKGGVKLADLKERMCRWPVGDPKEADFHFCGCQVTPGLPYCAEHAKTAYQAASKARTLQAEDFEEKESASSDMDMEVKHAVA
jgi:GcrA cell cycle regulator